MITKNDFLFKEFVRSFSYSDIHTNRDDSHDFVVNGRTYTTYGTRLATTMVGNLYKVSSDVEPIRYLLVVGVARQNKWESGISEEDAIEQAANNALMNPTITMELETKDLDDDAFESLCRFYIFNCQKQLFFATAEELKKKRFF